MTIIMTLTPGQITLQDLTEIYWQDKLVLLNPTIRARIGRRRRMNPVTAIGGYRPVIFVSPNQFHQKMCWRFLSYPFLFSS